MKAVIPAAGLGTRFLPIAKAVPKEMLPLGDRPVIHYAVAEAAAAGFDEILIIISHGKECIVQYFSPSPELVEHLRAAGKTSAAEVVREVSEIARIQFAYQEKMLGLGDAVRQGEKFIGNDPCFAVLLGDTVMQNASPLPAMLEAWKTFRKPSVCLEPCEEDRISRYGIAGGSMLAQGVFELDRLVEKPPLTDAPRLVNSSGVPLPFHAFAARYLFTPEIFRCLTDTPAGLGGEIQLTDAMKKLLGMRGMLGVCWPGKRLDIGNPAGLIEAARAMGI